MARGKISKAQSVETHTHLTIKVDSYEAEVSAGINHVAYQPEFGWASGGDERVYQFRNDLIVSGRATDPKARASDNYEITLSADESTVIDLDKKLKDLAELDEYGSPRYRKYRGREIPIYDPPQGLGLLDKVRGEPAWRTMLFVKPSFVEQWLALLSTQTDLFISLHECRVNRSRWVRRIEIHTVDPTEL